MIENALEWLQSNLIGGEPVNVNGRDFLPEAGHWREVSPRLLIKKRFVDGDGRPLSLGTIDALIQFVDGCPGDWQVVVGTDEATAYFDIGSELRSDLILEARTRIRVPFEYPEHKFNFSFVAFKDFLDQHADRIHEYDDLEAAVRFFKVNEASAITVAEQGAVISVSTAASKNLEGSSQRIPKSIVIDMPTGTREFLIPSTFLLRIMISNGAASFALTKKELDGSRETFLDAVREKLVNGLPANVNVYEGP
jgi:hypothetical protein